MWSGVADGVPGAIGDDVDGRGIVNEDQVLPFLQGDGGLGEVGVGKMHLVGVRVAV